MNTCATRALIKFKSLYSFEGGANSAHPASALVEMDGTLYGTTPRGGSADNGTVFAVSQSGTERVLHRFEDGSDGAHPAAALIDVHGVLYGTTGAGGAELGYGTIFAISKSGSERVLHGFRQDGDGTVIKLSLARH